MKPEEIKELIEQSVNKVKEELKKEAEDKGAGSPENKGKEEASAEVATLAKEIGATIAETVKEGLKPVAAAQPKVDERVTKVLMPRGDVRSISYPTDLASLSKEEKILSFMKALMYAKNDVASAEVLKALTEGVSAEGGYLVPTELSAEVYRILPDAAIMRRIATVIPMSSHTLSLNALATSPKAYWIREYRAKTTTSADLDQKDLTCNDLVCLLPVSEQLLADANISLVPFIINLFRDAIAAEEDNAFFTGAGTTQPRGISIETLGATVAAGGALTMDHVIAVIDSIPQSSANSPKAAFVGHRYVKRLCRNLKDTANNYIWRDGSMGRMSGQTEKLPDMLYGYPFYEQNDLAQTELYFGDWSKYIIGDRQQLEVRTTTEGGDAWRKNSVEIKAVERVDGRAVLLSAFAKITGI